MMCHDFWYTIVLLFRKEVENFFYISDDLYVEINKSIFDAIDTDNSGTLERDEVFSFIKELLNGMQLD